MLLTGASKFVTRIARPLPWLTIAGARTFSGDTVIETSDGAAGRLAVTLACLIAVSTQTMAAVATDPIPGVDVVVQKVAPGARFITRVTTDTDGCLVFGFLQSGRYEVSDTFGNHAWLEHDGGPAKWRLLGTFNGNAPVWSLVDEGDPT